MVLSIKLQLTLLIKKFNEKSFPQILTKYVMSSVINWCSLELNIVANYLYH